MEREQAPGRREQHFIDRLETELSFLTARAMGLIGTRAERGSFRHVLWQAMNNFGVDSFLEHFIQFARRPSAGIQNQGWFRPKAKASQASIFKIQANMNPAHRDRIALMRVCSGVFRRGEDVWHSGTDKLIQARAQPAELHGRTSAQGR